MEPVFVIFVLLLAASALITLSIACYAGARRDATGAKAVLVQMVGTSWWTISYALAILVAAVPGLGQGAFPEPFFWFKAMFLGVVVVPAAFLVFSLQYSGLDRWVNRYTLSLLLVEPVLMTLLIWTDSYHQLFFAGYGTGDADRFTGGVAFWLHSFYSHLIVFSGYGLLVWRLSNASPLYRKQVGLLLLSGLVVTVANLMTVFRLLPFAVDLTPLGFMVMGLTMLYNIKDGGLLDLIPVARHAVVESMSDAVLVLNPQGRVLDVNPAALQLLGLYRLPGPGTPVLEFFGAWSQLAPEYRDARERANAEVSLDSHRCLGIQINPLFGKHDEFLGRILVLRDLTPLKQAEAELRAQLSHNEQLRRELQELAIRDALTGLYNRRFLEETLARELAVAGREGRVLALCILDLDNFKGVNDTYGHSVGDEVLKGLATFFTANTRASDVACRFGGEEFVLVMPGADATFALERIDELRQGFSRVPFEMGGIAQYVTFSAGIACYPEHASDRETLLMEADRALYAAKSGGRNQVQVARVVPLSERSSVQVVSE